MQSKGTSLLFAVGDYVAGGVMGAVTAAAVHASIYPDLDLVLAMLLGMGIGMLTHLAIGLMLSPVLGLFHLMVPGSLIGMYGGMFFAMRDVMQGSSLGQTVGIGAAFGLLVTAGVRFYDRALRGPALGPGAAL